MGVYYPKCCTTVYSSCVYPESKKHNTPATGVSIAEHHPRTYDQLY